MQSIPQTRHFYQSIVWGIEQDESDVVWREEWEVVGDGSVKSPGGAKGSRNAKGKGKRIGSGKSDA